tara:strand:+ start:4111 stop:4524 length:414 start_codon:yes stop_codon:yes gene_type:complete
MDIDGVNYLTIVGDINILNIIEKNGIILSNEEVNNDTILIYLKENYFGNNCKIERTTKSCLKITFDFRNIPPNSYFDLLLQKYKKCWFKNEYVTEDGNCGIWIGEYINREKNIQIRKWIESPSNVDSELSRLGHEPM